MCIYILIYKKWVQNKVKILDQHKILKNKITNNNLDGNLIVFDIPIQFTYGQQTKSYFDQLEESTNDELTNTIYNVLYVPSLDIIKLHLNELKM